MKKAIIYDLDHTIFDPNTIERSIFQPVFDSLDLTSRSDFATLKNDFFSISLNAFIDKYLNKQSKEQFIYQLRNVNLPNQLEMYADGYMVQQIDTINYLITSGLKEFQNQKIDALGIRGWFAEIYIDDPSISIWEGKEEIMRLILNKHNYEPSELLVVGDNPKSEIKAGNNIGIETIQIVRKGIEASPIAKHNTKTLNELPKHIMS